MTLAERIVVLHDALARDRVPHAFGGAIALAYWTLEPRGTRDIDLNVFVPAARSEPVLRALPEGIEQPEGTVAAIARDGQVRLMWDTTPVDVFFDNVPVHTDAAQHRRTVPFENTRIPILGPIELAVFKAMFDRTQDWADIEAMLAAGVLDLDATREALLPMIGEDDPRYRRLDDAWRRASAVVGGDRPQGQRDQDDRHREGDG